MNETERGFGYGDCIALYKGSASIEFSDNTKSQNKFQVGQLNDGQIVLTLEDLDHWQKKRPVSLSGTTDEGWRVEIDGPFSEIRYLPPVGARNDRVAFRLNEFKISVRDSTPVESRFGITNFDFVGTRPTWNNGSGIRVLPLILEVGDSSLEAEIRPIADSARVIRTLRTLKNVAVICELVFSIADLSLETLSSLAGDICKAASVARGTFVQWIYRDLYDRDGAIVERLHAARITKVFSPLGAIDPGQREQTRLFLQNAVVTLRGGRTSSLFSEGVIETYLDAKSEADYLQMRGAKLAVALERLISVYSSRLETDDKHFVPQATFNELIPDLQLAFEDLLAKKGIKSKKAIRAIAGKGKLAGLNRKPFAHLIMKLCREIGLQLAQEEMELFVCCRNKLVHTGDFYTNCGTDEEFDRCSPLANSAEEYFFMVNILDKIFLRALGYSGNYVNARHLADQDERIDTL